MTNELSLRGLVELNSPILEIGRTCVHVAYRNGATIGVLWSEMPKR